MILTIGLFVCVTAVSLLFLQEIIQIFKKIVAIPGVVLLVPLLLASWIIEAYTTLWEWIGWTAQADIQTLLKQTAALLPFQMGSLNLIKVVLLTSLAFLPMCVAWGISRYNGRYTLPRIAYGLSLVIWIIAIFLVN